MRLLVLFSCLLAVPPVAAQEPARGTPFDSAPVEVDGEVLFRVRGVEALPAAERAAEIAANITAVASDRSFRPETLQAFDRGTLTEIAGGPRVMMYLSDEDARLEGAQRSLLALVYVDRIRQSIVDYRTARTRPSLTAGAARAAAAIGATAGLLVLLLWLLRRGEAMLQHAFNRRTAALAAESRHILRVERIWQLLRGVLGVVRAALVLLVALFLLQYVLVQFPWTRGAGVRLFEYVAGPLSAAAQEIVAAIPSMVLLAALFFITRYLMSLARLYFDAIQRGRIRLQNFEPEWAHPTYNLVRVIVIIFALIIAYPLIPGSDSDAFKGLSILAGVMLSLGSTSAVANIVAGYMIVFRRAFRIGDRVKIGQIAGCVTDVRLQVTHIRTAKNEEISIPNSVILGSEVLNYSRPAREGKLILHTDVRVGYQAPWRQVEAMLIEAARRTPDLLKEPPPFVLQEQLGDFAITYQINAYSDRADRMLYIYADLHRNILDEFNEHGVQIMTPAYESDPETPKIVARDEWFSAPARKDGQDAA
jgi:small-conductance mechanosensitive channel